PMAGQPQHSAAEAPVAGSAGHDHAIKIMLRHFRAQGLVAAFILGGGELCVDRVTVKRRVAHVVEQATIVQMPAKLFPRRGVACVLRCPHKNQSLQWPIVVGPPAAASASLASLKSTI